MELIKNLILLGSTILICVILGEVSLHFIVDEVDFLMPKIKSDPVLGHAISPGSAGHDEWGFRNRKVPKEAKIVAIGDSQTYGNSTPANNSWPALLEQFCKSTVYNMGVGGYGPPQYLYLLDTKAKSLKPELVLIGFYFGNDLFDTYRFYHIARNLNVNSIERQNPGAGKFLGGLRDWLAHNSLIYQMSKFIGGQLIDSLIFYDEERRHVDHVYPVISKNWKTFLPPETRYQVLDQSKEANRIGLSESLELLERIKENCQLMNVRCVIVLIPTKITVVWPTARDILNGKAYQEVHREVEEEGRVRHIVSSFLKSRDIEFVDPTEAMQVAARTDPLYPANTDGHLNARGNEVLATEIFHNLSGNSCLLTP